MIGKLIFNCFFRYFQRIYNHKENCEIRDACWSTPGENFGDASLERN